MPVRLSVRVVVAFAIVLVVLVTIAVMFPIISRRTIPGGVRRVVVVRTVTVEVGWVDRVLLVVRGGIVLLKLGPSGVELRVVAVVVVLVVGRLLELEGMTELEDGRIEEELLGRMLELGVGVAELENGVVEEVVVLVVVLKHSVTVLVTVSNGQLVTVTVARGIVIVAVLVIRIGGQAAQRAVAISQMAVERDCVEVTVRVVAGGPRVGPSSRSGPSLLDPRAISIAPIRSGSTRRSSPAFASRSTIATSSPRTGELANSMQETARNAQQFL
jgi:hypothetical protein